MRDKVNLAEAFASFDELWAPRVVAALNGQHVRIAKVEGTFCWHRHEDEDELFYVVAGRLVIHLRDEAGERTVTLEPGELFVVPRGVEHEPVAEAGTRILLFEPADVVNTGDVENERTKRDLEHL